MLRGKEKLRRLHFIVIYLLCSCAAVFHLAIVILNGRMLLQLRVRDFQELQIRRFVCRFFNKRHDCGLGTMHVLFLPYTILVSCSTPTLHSHTSSRHTLAVNPRNTSSSSSRQKYLPPRAFTVPCGRRQPEGGTRLQRGAWKAMRVFTLLWIITFPSRSEEYCLGAASSFSHGPGQW